MLECFPRKINARKILAIKNDNQNYNNTKKTGILQKIQMKYHQKNANKTKTKN
jgi:hypothetical protein